MYVVIYLIRYIYIYVYIYPPEISIVPIVFWPFAVYAGKGTRSKQSHGYCNKKNAALPIGQASGGSENGWTWYIRPLITARFVYFIKGPCSVV